MRRISQPVTIAVLACALVLQINTAWTNHNRPEPGRPYKQVRSDMVASAAASADRVDTVVLGDSIAESIWLDGMCGTTLNASVAGATTQQISDLGERVFAKLRTRKVLVAIGTNDAYQGIADDAAFEVRYDAMLERLPTRPFALVGIGNSDIANAYVKAKAAEIEAVFIPPIAPEHTTDGIHPDEKGREIWRNRAVSACARSEKTSPLA
ncbi:SGNH/GDSL hydrolase family protein [Sphingorhabdus sp. Alg239-R122]|uniref:SGNH/GDSL hydrolase family protein n=1 Tax=Sphingorhabdus sp. Alg239-R122 TaxID=2305989 RepID=UPI0013DC1104|nr:SGNH/GDSL hydrolase family protein [Sphingorhabdus sp. Alg239-R122]